MFEDLCANFSIYEKKIFQIDVKEIKDIVGHEISIKPHYS